MSTYSEQHANRTNLIIHLIAVPLFIIAHVLLLAGLFYLELLAVVLSVGAIGVSLAVQGKGHSLETVSPEPFTSAGNFLARIYREQFITFPAFVLNGQFFNNLRQD